MDVSTTIRHIRSHTVERDLTSIGNEAADRRARLSAEYSSHTEAACFHDTLVNPVFELPFITDILTSHPDASSDPPTFSFKQNPIHDRLKDTLRGHFITQQRNTWETRSSRGTLPNLNSTAVYRIIKRLWRKPTSNYLRLLLTALTNCSQHTHIEDKRTQRICPYCGTRQPMTPHHSLYVFPPWGTCGMRREKSFISSFHTMTPNIDSSLLQIRFTSTPRSKRLNLSRELQELRHQSELASPLPTDLNNTPQHVSPPVSLSDSFVFSLQPLSPPSSVPQPKSTLRESSLHCGDLKAPRPDPHSRLYTPYSLTLSPTETTKCMHSGDRCM